MRGGNGLEDVSGRGESDSSSIEVDTSKGGERGGWLTGVVVSSNDIVDGCTRKLIFVLTSVVM